MTSPEATPTEMTPADMTPTDMTLLIGSKYLPLEEITDPTVLPAARAIKGTGVTLDLGAHVLMGGFLALRDEGAISLRYVEAKKMRVFTSHHVVVEKTGESSYVPPTIEGGLFQAVSSSAPRSVKKVVGEWFGPDVEDPGGRAYLPAWNHLVSMDMIVMEDVPIGKKGKIQRAARPNAPLIAKTLPQLARWSERWTTFSAEEAEVAKHLFSEIKATLGWKKKSSSDTDNSSPDWF